MAAGYGGSNEECRKKGVILSPFTYLGNDATYGKNATGEEVLSGHILSTVFLFSFFLLTVWFWNNLQPTTSIGLIYRDKLTCNRGRWMRYKFELGMTLRRKLLNGLTYRVGVNGNRTNWMKRCTGNWLEKNALTFKWLFAEKLRAVWHMRWGQRQQVSLDEAKNALKSVLVKNGITLINRGDL